VPGRPVGLILVRPDSAFALTAMSNVARNPLPTSSNYNFRNFPAGSYLAFAYRDSTRYSADSSNIRFVDSLTLQALYSYNIYIQGFFDSLSGSNRLTLKSIRLN
jgi:hypothetical protein